jgi:aminotransferase
VSNSNLKDLSYKTEKFSESIIREMTRICDQVNGLNLSQGFPDFDAPEEIKEAAMAAIRDGFNQYPVTFGEPEFRDAIAKKFLSYNQVKCDPETDITVTCGATEAMISTLMAIINPGDEIIIFEPYYENYGPDAILSGATPRYVTLHTPDWKYDSDELAKAFNEKTKAIIINTPNNPTGKVFSRAELSEIAELCIAHNCYAITDEIYEHILYDGAEHVSIASLPDMADRAITINGLTKTYSVTGWRVGWAIASERVTQRIRKVHDFLTVGAPTPFQKAGVTALAMPGSYYDNLKASYLRSRDFLYNALLDVGINAFLPNGSYYIMVEADKLMKQLGCADDFEFSRKLIDITGVASVPGTSFYKDGHKGKNQVRFTYCKKMETLELVKERLQKLI